MSPHSTENFLTRFPDEEWAQPFRLIELRDSEGLEKWLANFDPRTAIYGKGRTLLGHAVRHEWLDGVARLLDFGFDPNEIEKDDFTKLPSLKAHSFAINNNDLFSLLVSSGKDGIISNDDVLTAFAKRASFVGWSKAVKDLANLIPESHDFFESKSQGCWLFVGSSFHRGIRSHEDLEALKEWFLAKSSGREKDKALFDCMFNAILGACRSTYQSEKVNRDKSNEWIYEMSVFITKKWLDMSSHDVSRYTKSSSLICDWALNGGDALILGEIVDHALGMNITSHLTISKELDNLNSPGRYHPNDFAPHYECARILLTSLKSPKEVLLERGIETSNPGMVAAAYEAGADISKIKTNSRLINSLDVYRLKEEGSAIFDTLAVICAQANCFETAGRFVEISYGKKLLPSTFEHLMKKGQELLFSIDVRNDLTKKNKARI